MEKLYLQKAKELLRQMQLPDAFFWLVLAAMLEGALMATQEQLRLLNGTSAK